MRKIFYTSYGLSRIRSSLLPNQVRTRRFKFFSQLHVFRIGNKIRKMQKEIRPVPELGWAGRPRVLGAAAPPPLPLVSEFVPRFSCEIRLSKPDSNKEL